MRGKFLIKKKSLHRSGLLHKRKGRGDFLSCSLQRDPEAAGQRYPVGEHGERPLCLACRLQPRLAQEEDGGQVWCMFTSDLSVGAGCFLKLIIAPFSHLFWQMFCVSPYIKSHLLTLVAS